MDKLSAADHLASEWIINEANVQDKMHSQIVDFYIHRILLPLGGIKKVKDFLIRFSEGCQIPEARNQVLVVF